MQPPQLAEVGSMIHGEFVLILKNDASLEDDRQTNIFFLGVASSQ